MDMEVRLLGTGMVMDMEVRQLGTGLRELDSRWRLPVGRRPSRD